MVWLYGGGFTVGWSSDSTCNGEFIVDQEDIIVVSIR
jgi:carboxylesterase type B